MILSMIFRSLLLSFGDNIPMEKNKNRPYIGRFHYWLATVQVPTYGQWFIAPTRTLNADNLRS